MVLFLSLSLAPSLSLYLSIYLYLYLSIYLSISLSSISLRNEQILTKEQWYSLILISWMTSSSSYLVDVSIPTRTEWEKVSKLQGLAWTTVGVKSLSCCSLLIPNNANSPLDGFRNAARHLIHVFFRGKRKKYKYKNISRKFSVYKKCFNEII